MWEDYRCYFVVIDSQCDAFSQVSIIGDAFKVYLTQCFVIICHSSASEWLFNVSGVKLFSLLQGLLDDAMLSALCIIVRLTVVSRAKSFLAQVVITFSIRPGLPCSPII